MRFVSVTHELREERSALVDLLSGLDPASWASPTECPSWSVGDIALHLLGDDLSLLARQRDDAVNGLMLFAVDHPGATFRELLDGFNERWVAASRFFSRTLVVDLLAQCGEWTADFYETVDPEQLGEPVGLFAATDHSPYWQIIGREYLERWAHHHQIRRAIGEDDLGERFLRSAAEVVFTCLGVALAGVDADEGRQFTVAVPSIDQWSFERRVDHWHVEPTAVPRGGLTLVLDPERATTVLSRGLATGEVWNEFVPSGDPELAAAVEPVITRVLARP